MRRLLIALSIIACVTCKPQRNPYAEQSDRPGPGQLQAYVKFSPSDIRHLKTRGYALPLATASPAQIPQGFRSTIAPDTNVASTQQRRPAYEEENYPVQNAIQLQGRPQQAQRRPNAPPQQFRQQLQEVRGLIYSVSFLFTSMKDILRDYLWLNEDFFENDLCLIYFKYIYNSGI